MRNILTVLIFFLIISCGSNNPKLSNGSKILQHKILNPDMDVMYPSIRIFDTLALVVSLPTLKKNNFISVYSLNDYKQIISFANYGKAGDEFLRAAIVSGNSKEKHFSLFDSRKQKLFTYAIKEAPFLKVSLVESKSIQRFDEIFQIEQLANYNDQYNVGVVVESNDGLLALFDNDYKLITTFCSNPYGDVLSIKDLLNFCRGNIAVKNKYIVYSTTHFPYIVCYSINDGKPEKLWEDKYMKSYHKIDATTGELVFPKESPADLIGMHLGEKFIYLFLHDGKKIDLDFNIADKSDANKVLIYDYKGSRIAEFLLDQSFFRGTVSKNEKILYGIARVPEFALISFDLPDL